MNALKIVATAIAAGCLAIPSVPARAADTVPETSFGTLTVTGQGQISRAPDLATVAANIVTSDDSAARALSENNRRFAALGAKLAALGISANDITSTSLSSYFNPRPAARMPNPGAGPFGFVVTRNAQINVAALAQTGAVIDAATAAGATQINGVAYGLRDPRAVERAALAAAVADAAAQAQTIAAAAHVQIVRILRIGNEAGPPPGRIMPLAMKSSLAGADAVPTTIAPSDMDVNGTVTITYVIR
jgi:hypothetical protein